MSNNENISENNNKMQLNKITNITFKKQERIPLLLMTIDIGKDNKKEVIIYQDSNPGNLAFEFCKENNLDYSSLQIIKSNIEQALISVSDNHKSPIKGDMNNTKEDENKDEIVNQIENNNKNKSDLKSINQLIPNTEKNNETSDKQNKNTNNEIPFQYIVTKNKKYKCIITCNKSRSQSYKNNHSLITNPSKHSIQNCKKYLTYSSVNSSKISSPVNSNKNIFERLFKDSEIKRLTYRRPCHFSNTNINKRNKRNKSTRTSNNTSLATISLFSVHDIGIESDYAKSYMLKPNHYNNYIHLFSRKHAITLDKPGLEIQKSKKSVNNNQNFNKIVFASSSYKPKILSSDEKGKIIKFYQLFRNRDNSKWLNLYEKFSPEKINSKEVREGINKSNIKSSIDRQEKVYKQIKEPMCKIRTQKRDYSLENIRREAFSNLFDDLKDNKDTMLSKSTLSLSKISPRAQKDLSPVINLITKNNLSYSKDDFILLMKDMFKIMSLKAKRNIIAEYKNKNDTVLNTVNVTKIVKKNKSLLFNSSTTISPIAKKGKSLCKEKKGLFNIDNNASEKKNLYYLYGN